MFANCYGLDGVTKLIQIMKTEIAADAGQAGVADLHNISPSLVSRIVIPLNE
jgi:L-lactate dehydrogenase (cytochrome)